jgi:hypothetical protein
VTDIRARLAELDATNAGREAAEPLVARWWDVAGVGRDDLTPRTPVQVGTRTVFREADGALAVQGVIRLGPDSGKDFPALQAAAGLATEWFEDGVPPFTHPRRRATVMETPPDGVTLALRCALPQVAGVQDALSTMFELERAMMQALGLSPGLMGRPPWT